MPLTVVLDTLAISALGACARTVFCTAGGSSLNLREAVSTLGLQPARKPASARSVITYLFIFSFLCEYLRSEPHPESRFNPLMALVANLCRVVGRASRLSPRASRPRRCFSGET